MNNFLQSFNDHQAQASFGPDKDKNMAVAIIPYIIPILFWLPIVVDKNSNFCKFHANQQFAWFLLLIAASIVSTILGFIPILGVLLRLCISLAELAIMIALIYGASTGMALKLPVIGDIFQIFK